MKFYLLILSLILFAAACGPQLSSKEKEDLQTKANREADYNELQKYTGLYQGTVLMKRNGTRYEGTVNVSTMPSKSDKSKTILSVNVSATNSDEQGRLIQNFDVTYESTEIMDDVIYPNFTGVTGGMVGGVNSNASMTIADKKLVLSAMLFTITATKVRDLKKR